MWDGDARQIRRPSDQAWKWAPAHCQWGFVAVEHSLLLHDEGQDDEAIVREGTQLFLTHPVCDATPLPESTDTATLSRSTRHISPCYSKMVTPGLAISLRESRLPFWPLQMSCK